MKKIYTLLLLLNFLLLGFFACSDDKNNDDITIVDPTGKITLDRESIKLYLDEEDGTLESSFKITEGAGDYKIINLDTDLVEANLAGNSINVKGLQVGTATLIVMDKDSNVKSVSVAVGYSKLAINKEEVSLELLVGKKQKIDISILTGSGGYKFKTDVDKIVDIKITGNTISLTNIATKGKAIITLTDRMGNEASISYEIIETLKPYTEEELEQILKKTAPIYWG